MAAGEIEPKLLMDEGQIAAAKPKMDKQLTKPCCILFNISFSMSIAFLIIYGMNLNILSSYNSLVSYYEYTIDDTNGCYFHCGWNKFNTYYCNDAYYHNGMFSCNSFGTEINNWSIIGYNYPAKSGKVWFHCNIISFISLFISEIGYIVIVIQRKYFDVIAKIKKLTLKKIYIITIFFQSFIPTLFMLIAIIYWFQKNNVNTGCWNANGINLSIPTIQIPLQFNDRTIGITMIFDIIAVILLGIHCIIHCHLLLLADIKRKIIRKQMLAEQVDDDEIFEGEGYLNQDIQNMNLVRILSIAGAEAGDDKENEDDIKMDDIEYYDDEYSLIKSWFFKSVSIPNDYKENYYNKFIENGFDNFVAIKSINNEDLIDIGVDKLGHRKTIIISIQKL